MKDKNKLFKLLRDAVETPTEFVAPEDFMRKINREMPSIEVIDDIHKKFDGLVYRKHKKDGRYYFSTSLTRSVWKFFNGEIPEGYEIHHQDDDKYNDNISNLALLSREEHLKLHADKRRGVKTFRKPKLKKFVCEYCGKEFEALTTNGLLHYCSDECHKKHRQDAGNYMTERTCTVCGKKFKACKGHPTTHCSGECVVKSLKNKNGCHS